MSDENPFADLWGDLKNRGRVPKHIKRKGTRYVVQLTEGELASLIVMRNLYQGIDSVIERVTGNEVEFRLPQAAQLAHRSFIKSRK